MSAPEQRSMTMSLRRHDAPALGYIGGVVLLGAGLIGLCLYRVTFAHQDARILVWAAFAVLTLLCGGLSLRLPIASCVVSFSDGLIFLSVLLFGPELSALTAALDGYASSTRNGGTLRKRLFNTAGMALTVGLSARLFEAVRQGSAGAVTMDRLLLATISLAASQFVLNTTLVVIVVALSDGMSPLAVLRKSFVWSALSMLAGSLAAALVYMAIQSLGAATCLAILPVPVALHLMYRLVLKKRMQRSL